MNAHKDRAGFTLVELIVTIVIISIVAAVSFAVMASVRSNAETEAARTDAQQVQRELRALLVFGDTPDDAFATVEAAQSPPLLLDYVDGDSSGTLDLGETVLVWRSGGLVASFVLSASEWTPILIGSETAPTTSTTLPPFSPADLGPALWLDASDGSTITETGGSVSSWADKSGNGYDVSAVSASYRPTIGVDYQNGLDVLSFTSDSLQSAATDIGKGWSGATVYMVKSYDSSATTATPFVSRGPSTVTRFGLGVTSSVLSSNGRPTDSTSSAIFNNAVTDLPYGAFFASTSVFDRAGASMSLYRNTLLEASRSFGTPGTFSDTSSSGFTVGAYSTSPSASPYQFFDGSIAELLIFPAAHDSSTRAQVWTYLFDKWALDAPPAKVSGVSVGSFDSGKVTVSWDATTSGSPLEDYTVQISSDGTSWTDLVDGVSTATLDTFTGLPGGETRWFRIAGVNEYGTGEFSDPVSVVVASAAFTVTSVSPELWIDASDASTISETGGSVSQWDDKSGGGFHFVQGASSNQPTWGSRTLNGLNVVDFDGTNDYMGRAFPIPINATPGGVWSVVAVVESDIVSGSPVVMGIDYSVARNSQHFRLNGNQFQTLGWNSSGTVTTETSGTTATTATPYVLSSLQGASSTNTFELFVNGSSNGPSTVVNQKSIGSTYGLGLGSKRSNEASYVWNGAIAEIIAFDRLITPAERVAVENYLADKWGVSM